MLPWTVHHGPFYAPSSLYEGWLLGALLSWVLVMLLRDVYMMGWLGVHLCLHYLDLLHMDGEPFDGWWGVAGHDDCQLSHVWKWCKALYHIPYCGAFHIDDRVLSDLHSVSYLSVFLHVLVEVLSGLVRGVACFCTQKLVILCGRCVHCAPYDVAYRLGFVPQDVWW